MGEIQCEGDRQYCVEHARSSPAVNSRHYPQNAAKHTFHLILCICHAAMVAATAEGKKSTDALRAVMLMNSTTQARASCNRALNAERLLFTGILWYDCDQWKTVHKSTAVTTDRVLKTGAHDHKLSVCV